MSETLRPAPEDVRLRFADGRTVDCVLERAPHLDRPHRKGTVEYWTARPAAAVDPSLTYQVMIGSHPPLTGVHVELGAPGRGLLDWAPPAE